MNLEKATAAVVALVLLSLPGCKRDTAPGTPGSSSAVAAAGEQGAAAPQEEADAQLGNKLHEYLDCFNNFSSSVRSSWSRYRGWVDEEKGVTGKERNVQGLLQIYGAETCMKGLDKAKGLSPSLPDLEGAAEAYRTAATDLVPLIQAAYKYYDQKDYKDDAFARAKEMHGPLSEAFKRFFEADKALDAKFAVLKDALDERSLKRLESDPNRKLQYLVEKSIADAKKLLDASNVKKLEELDEAKFQAALTAYDTDVTNLETFVGENKAEASKVSSIDSVIRYGQDLVKTSKALIRRKREKKDEQPPVPGLNPPQLENCSLAADNARRQSQSSQRNCVALWFVAFRGVDRLAIEPVGFKARVVVE
jgi:hypothetical protein